MAESRCPGASGSAPALLALLVFLDEQPALARLCVVQALAAGPEALERRSEIVAKLVTGASMRAAARPAGTLEPPLPLTAEGVLGAVSCRSIHYAGSQKNRESPSPTCSGS